MFSVCGCKAELCQQSTDINWMFVFFFQIRLEHSFLLGGLTSIL